MPYLAGYVSAQDQGAVGNGTHDDTSAINAALSYVWTTFGGGVVVLPPTDAGYLVSGPISIPPFTYLVGQSAVTLNQFTTMPTTLSRLVASASWVPGSATGVIAVQSKTPGGWSANTQSCGVRNLVVDCSLNSSANLNAAFLAGPVFDVHLEDVLLWSPTGYGLSTTTQTESGITPTSAYRQHYTRTSAVNATAGGFNLPNVTDSTYTDCLAYNTAGNGWNLNSCGNTTLTACRAELNSSATASRGFDITGTPGGLILTGCSTNQNGCEGVRIHAATPATTSGGGITIASMKCRADGAGGTNANGVKITASTIPVTVSGLVVEAAQVSASWWPTTGIEIDTSSNIIVEGSVLQGVTTPWSDGGGNTNLTRTGCYGLSGDPNTQALVPLNGQPVGVLTTVTSTTTIANTNVLSTLQTATVPANTPAAGAIYHVVGYGVYSVTGTPALTFTLYWGGTAGTAIASVPAVTAASGISSAPFWYEALVTFRTATTCTAAINLCVATSASTDAAATYISTPTTATTVTTSANEALAVGFTWSTGAPQNTLSLLGGEIDRLA